MKIKEQSIKRDRLIKDIENTASALRVDRDKWLDTTNLEGYLLYLVNQL